MTETRLAHPHLPAPLEQILITLAFLESQRRATDWKSIEDQGDFYFCQYRSDWSGAVEDLIARGLIERRRDEYALAASAKFLAEALRKQYPKSVYFYDEYFARVRNSRAHALFRERVYGKNLAQHGMMDMSQFQLMLRLLELSGNHRVLDLGCGNGMITEYISELTGAHVTGVDTSRQAITDAIERIRSKSARQSYIVGDMANAPLLPRSFDVVISIDAMYFADLPKIMDQVQRVAKAVGLLMAFVSSSIAEDKPGELLHADGTNFAKELQRRGLGYKTWDLTEEEIAHWRLKRAAALEFRQLFEEEGNSFLFERRFLEADLHQAYLESRRLSRYLYRVQL